MYNRIYKFFIDKNLIYPLQFGFRQKYSTVHALISLTESIKKKIDDGNIGCGVFVDFQQAFDTVDHDILLSKLEHYTVCGLANEWFKSHPLNRKQYVSINSYDLNLLVVKFGVPQRSVLGPLLFVINANDLKQAIKFCNVHHFASGTNLLHFIKSVNRLNKYVNFDLKSLPYWLCQQNLT